MAVVLVLVLAFFAGGGWLYAGQIRDGASEEAVAESRILDKDMLQALAKGLGHEALVRHGPGTTLFREGAAGVLAYGVLEGRVAVTIQGKLVQRVGPGGVFGEVALVDQATRAATATTESECALIAINWPNSYNVNVVM